jgi:hypothetical protein
MAAVVADRCVEVGLTCMNAPSKQPPLPGTCGEWNGAFGDSNCAGMPRGTPGAHRLHDSASGASAM